MALSVYSIRNRPIPQLMPASRSPRIHNDNGSTHGAASAVLLMLAMDGPW